MQTNTIDKNFLQKGKQNLRTRGKKNMELKIKLTYVTILHRAQRAEICFKLDLICNLLASII